MHSHHHRRRFLKTLPTGIAAGILASGSRNASGIENPNAVAIPNKHIIYHYAEPFDYGVMQEPIVERKDFVGKNTDLPNCFFNDYVRMRWAVQHMSVLQRTLPLTRSGDVLRFHYDPVQLRNVKLKYGKGNGVNPEVVSGKHISVPDWLKLTNTDAFMVVYLDENSQPIVATEQYFNGMKPHTLHHLWSMSKSLSVGLVAIALHEGKLQREQKIGDLVPELRNSGLTDATLDHVLNMASAAKQFSGEDWSFENLVDFAMNRMFVAFDFLEADTADTAVRDLGIMRFLQRLQKEEKREHGKAFDYKDVDARAALAAAEHAFGRPFQELFTQLIWSKIGAEHDAYICCDQFGCAATPYGMSATLRDCARWGLCHLAASPRKVLPAEFVQGLVNPHPSFASEETRHFGETTGKAYRDQYWIYRDDKMDGFYADGWMGQRIHVFPRLNVVIVHLATSWDREKDTYESLVPSGPALTRIAQHVHDVYRKAGK